MFPIVNNTQYHILVIIRLTVGTRSHVKDGKNPFFIITVYEQNSLIVHLKCSGSLQVSALLHCKNLLELNFYLRPNKLTSSPIPAFAHKLIEAAFLDYARLLRSLGLREGAALWASRAGTAGEQLMEELSQGEGGSPDTILGKEQAAHVQESTE